MLNKGNFSSYIYIPVKCNKSVKKKCELCYEVLCKLVEKQFSVCNDKRKNANFYNGKNNSLNKEEISKHIFYQLDNLNLGKNKQNGLEETDFNEPLHITIAGSVHIKKHMIVSFIEKIKEELQNQSCVDLYKSQKHTKYFCCYSVKWDQQELHLNSLINKINGVLEKFGLPNNYAKRMCHISLAYTDVNLEFILEKNKLNTKGSFWPDISEIIEEDNSEKHTKSEVRTSTDVHSPSNNDVFYIYVSRICVRVGNKLYEIPFKSFHDDLNFLPSDSSYASST
ncbi:U6 snRNA phosphodiesterase, putative [Plasmodium malariae]|uniref:U6 snRNA phosphodiesterase 1 n=1 Tax=Plasmodium malariae TaxID=5858 RepID=A0A1C3L0K5_PLAMA|nr:U6 snRNA phosphodiesterase, putative [Plasmodium malariae]